MKHWLVGWVLMVMMAGAAVGAPAFRAEQNLPQLGLGLRILAHASPEPLAPVQTFTYTFTQGGESSRRDRYDPRELWYETQHAGQWRDEDGNLLILGRPTHQLPAVPSDIPHVAREDFEKARNQPAVAFVPTSLPALTDWVSVFAGSRATTSEVLRLPPGGASRAVRFTLPNPATLAYAFQVSQRQPDGRSGPSPWFVAVVRVADGTPREKVQRDFEAQFLASVSSIPLAGAGSVGGVRTRDLSAASPAAVTNTAEDPSRLAARKSIANMKDWWYAEAHGYIFLSDIRGSTGNYLIRDLQANLPALRRAFARLVPPLESSGEVSVVRIFEDASAYRQYVGQDMEWSIGAWIPMRRELVVLSQDKEKEQTMAIIRHEGFHQYLSYASGVREHALWFNEGHACFFESAQVDRTGRVSLPEGDRVDTLIANLPAAAQFLPMVLRANWKEFYQGSEASRRLNYTTAWALVYFLQKGAPASGLKQYQTVLPTYLDVLKTTGDAGQATAAAFRAIAMDRLQQDFVEFWRRDRSAARRYDPLK